MYHRVVVKEPAFTNYNIHVTQQKMEQQLVFLKDHGFEPVGFEDLLHRPIPEKPVILTFDDGYEDNYLYLFPLLKKYRMKAVLYLLGNRRRRNNFWDIPGGIPEAALLKPGQIKEMLKSGLVEFGAHSMSHAGLAKLSPEEIREEIGGSKRALEAFLKRPVVSFAYPFGSVNEDIKNITAREGYIFGVAVYTGPARFSGDLMEIRRIEMFPQTSMCAYRVKTSGFYLRIQRSFGCDYLRKTKETFQRYRRLLGLIKRNRDGT